MIRACNAAIPAASTVHRFVLLSMYNVSPRYTGIVQAEAEIKQYSKSQDQN